MCVCRAENLLLCRRFDACFGLLAVILCPLMLMRLRQLMWQHCDTGHISPAAKAQLSPSLLGFSSLLSTFSYSSKSYFVFQATKSSKLPSVIILSKNVFRWCRMAAFTCYLFEASCTIGIPSYITQTRRQISLRRQQYIAQMSVATN